MDKRKFTDLQERKICAEYFSEEKPSCADLAEKWNCDQVTIGFIIKRNGYKLRTKSEARKGKIPWNKKFAKEQELQICKEYFSKEEPSTVILGKKRNCNQTVIRDVLIRNGYKLRTFSEARKGKIPWNKGIPTSEETKRKKRIFTKEQELQICKEYFSKEKPSVAVLAKRWNCDGVSISNIIKRNGYKLRTLNTPEAIQQALRNGYGKKCYYNNEFFPSLLERDCYIKLKKNGYKVIHNFLNRFDFLVLVNNKKVVVEFHPFDFNLTDKQYYLKRRELLDEYGHKDLKLIVIKDLKEIENKLGNLI